MTVPRVVALALAALVACGGQQSVRYAGTRTHVRVPRPALVLPDTSGRAYDVRARRADTVTALLFGYTHCPDVCPATVSELAAARRGLPESLRSRVEVVFVTEDPERDTPAALRSWLDNFDAEFVGLSGGGARTREVLRHLDLAATTLDRDGFVDHAPAVYLFAPGDAVTVVHTAGSTAAEFAADFTRLLTARAR